MRAGEQEEASRPSPQLAPCGARNTSPCQGSLKLVRMAARSLGARMPHNFYVITNALNTFSSLLMNIRSWTCNMNSVAGADTQRDSMGPRDHGPMGSAVSLDSRFGQRGPS